MIKMIDKLLNTLTMYRLVLYGLVWLVAVALLLAGIGSLTYSIGSMLLSLGILLIVCFGVNYVLSLAYRVSYNYESSLITALILFFVMKVPSDSKDFAGLVIAGLVAMASKYVITWRGANVLNPAAIGAFISSICGLGIAAWWLATPKMLPFVAIFGLFVVRKIRRFELLFSFLVPAFILLAIHGVSVQTVTTSYPIVFLGTIMLTEPGTMPHKRMQRIIFGILVGLVFGAQLNLGPFSTSPHFALLVGNILALIISYHMSAELTLVISKQLTPTTHEFTFESSRKILFTPGQYMEWTMPGVKLDSRGNRRTFTIASSPEDKYVSFAAKFYSPSSQYKKSLLSLKPGSKILAAHIEGDFVLPHDNTKKLVFLAGGIGVTPFISMLRHCLATDTQRDITLFYFAKSEDEMAYKDLLRTAYDKGIKTIPLIGNQRLDVAVLAKYVENYPAANFYISGPLGFVQNYKSFLKANGAHHVHTDYFAGY